MLVIAIGLHGQVNGGCHCALGGESAVDAHQLYQACDQQPGGEDKSDAYRNFDCHQNAPGVPAPARFAGKSRLRVKHFIRSGTGDHERRRSSSEQGCDDCQKQRASCSSPIEMQRTAEIECRRKVTLHGGNDDRRQQNA